MGRRTLHERRLEYHKIGDMTHGYLSSLCSAIGINFVCKISQKGYKAAETTNYVCRPCPENYLNHKQRLRFPKYPCSRPEPQFISDHEQYIVMDTSWTVTHDG